MIKLSRKAYVPKFRGRMLFMGKVIGRQGRIAKEIRTIFPKIQIDRRSG